MRASRPCVDCQTEGRLTLTRRRRPYCDSHAAQHERDRGPRPQYDAEWRRYSKQRIAEEGQCCVCGTTEDLTTDHSGAVVCRADNTRWRNTGFSRTT